MTDGPFVCIDPIVPLELSTLAADRAVAVRPDNDGSNLHAAGDRLRFWATGMVLRVRFLDTPELTERVMEAASAWTEHANLEFQVVGTGPAEIRVTFLDDGNWSALGTDALVPELFPADEPTMCLSEILAPISSSRVDRIARHEFGHAIGLVHEHSSPAAGIGWNKPVVYAALGKPPNSWTPEMVDTNVFRVYDATVTNHTAIEHTGFDPDSIMLYTFPPEWTHDRRTFPDNTKLSATDAAFVRRIYPGRR
jgi:hypothetical protein